MNGYQQYIQGIVGLVETARSVALGNLPPASNPPVAKDAPCALFFAPHPDDECISGGIALRLRREARMNVLNVAVTQGSNQARQAGRLRELQEACAFIGFGLLTTGPAGLERINPKTRQTDPAHWSDCVQVIAEILRAHQPRVVMFPHEQDWNSTHIGTHYLLTDALLQMPASFECLVIESEFWGQMDDPNLMLEISPEDLADMVAATTFHVGEVARNPYHLLLPAWMMDNVRRGGELVGGQGGAAPNFLFASLYRLRKWSAGQLTRFYEGGRNVPAGANLQTALCL